MTSPINKFAVFSYNYPIGFIEEVWKDEEWIAKHLREKFRGYYDRHGSDGVMLAFYMGLSTDRQQQLEEYILNLEL